MFSYLVIYSVVRSDTRLFFISVLSQSYTLQEDRFGLEFRQILWKFYAKVTKRQLFITSNENKAQTDNR